MAEHGIVGDAHVTELPETEVLVEELAEEKKMARYSRSKEFERLRDYMEGRIQFFQRHLPDGRPIAGAVDEDLISNWKAANIVIGEFKSVLTEYDNARDAVENSDASRA